MPIAYSYIRFSSAEQIHGDSLRRQLELSEQYAIKNGLSIDTSFHFRDLGLSAFDETNITKGALGQFLELVKTGQIQRGSYLLIESLDRLSRAQVMDALEIFIGLLNAGISIVTLSDGNVYSRENTNDNFTQLIISISIMSRAYEESATKSKRIKAAWEQKRKNIATRRLTARCPYWMKASEGPTGFELIPERAEVVRLILKWAKDGLGNNAIIKKLHSENIKPFSETTKGWHESYIQKLFTNKALYGEFQRKVQIDGKLIEVGEAIEDYFPALISKAEWLYISAIRAERQDKGGTTKGKTLSNLFSGMLICGYCKGPMQMGGHVKHNGDGTTRTNRFVGCSTARRGRGCKFKTWNYNEIESIVLNFCKSVDFAEILNVKPNVNPVETNRLKLIDIQSEVLKTSISIQNLIAAIEEDGAKELKTLIKRIAELEKTKEVLMLQEKSLAEAITLQVEEETTGLLQRQALEKLIDQLAVLKGEELRDLRVKLANRIKRAIKQIALLPGGQYFNDQKKTEFTKQMVEVGYDPEELRAYFKPYDINFSKENRKLIIVFTNNESISIDKNGVWENLIQVDNTNYLEILRQN